MASGIECMQLRLHEDNLSCFTISIHANHTVGVVFVFMLLIVISWNLLVSLIDRKTANSLLTIRITACDLNKMDFSSDAQIHSPDRFLSDRSQRSPGAGVEGIIRTSVSIYSRGGRPAIGVGLSCSLAQSDVHKDHWTLHIYIILNWYLNAIFKGNNS